MKIAPIITHAEFIRYSLGWQWVERPSKVGPSFNLDLGMRTQGRSVTCHQAQPIQPPKKNLPSFLTLFNTFNKAFPWKGASSYPRPHGPRIVTEALGVAGSPHTAVCDRRRC